MKTYEEGRDELHGMLCNIRILTILAEMRTEVSNMIEKLDCDPKDEYNYLECKAKMDALKEVGDLINNKIISVSNKSL